MISGRLLSCRPFLLTDSHPNTHQALPQRRPLSMFSTDTSFASGPSPLVEPSSGICQRQIRCYFSAFFAADMAACHKVVHRAAPHRRLACPSAVVLPSARVASPERPLLEKATLMTAFALQVCLGAPDHAVAGCLRSVGISRAVHAPVIMRASVPTWPNSLYCVTHCGRDRGSRGVGGGCI
jgi:hypothetical protein